jgi:hypothetical protein
MEQQSLLPSETTSFTGLDFLRIQSRSFASRKRGRTNGRIAANTRGKPGSRASKSHRASEGLSG